MKDFATHFWERVAIKGPDDCWLWTGGKHDFGYGSLQRSDNKKWATAHRVAYELTHGSIPEGAHIMHRCDNPPCCNPAHLRAGTSRDNMLDKERKGRGGHAVGERNHSVLTADDVRKLRRLKATTKITYVELGEIFGITQVTARNIVLRKKWKHVE